MAKNCLEILKNESPELHEYLRGKAGVEYDPTTGKGGDQYIKAARELQEKTLDGLQDIYGKLGIKGFVKPIKQAGPAVILPEENIAPNIVKLKTNKAEVILPADNKPPNIIPLKKQEAETETTEANEQNKTTQPEVVGKEVGGGVSKTFSEKQQELVNTLPKKKVNYKDIKGVDWSFYLNNPHSLDAPWLRSAKKIYEDIKAGKPIKDTPSVNENMQLMDGHNRIAAQLAAGIENVDVAIIDKSFYDKLGKHLEKDTTQPEVVGNEAKIADIEKQKQKVIDEHDAEVGKLSNQESRDEILNKYKAKYPKLFENINTENGINNVMQYIKNKAKHGSEEMRDINKWLSPETKNDNSQKIKELEKQRDAKLAELEKQKANEQNKPTQANEKSTTIPVSQQTKTQESNDKPDTETVQGSETQSEKRSFRDRAYSLADKIEKEGLHSALPSWAKADLPEGTQQAGFGGKSLDKAIAAAIRLVGDAVDAGTEIKNAIESGFQSLKQYYSKNTKSFDENRLRDEFTKNMNSLFETGEQEDTEDQLGDEDLKIIDTPLSDDPIAAYNMTRNDDITKAFGSDVTQAIVFNELLSEEKFAVQMGMLQDGKNMIAAAQSMFGSTDLSVYGPQLFKYIQNMSSQDAQLTNKRAVLLATLLGEIKNDMYRDQSTADSLRPLENIVSRYYTNFMHVTAKNLAAGRLLRLFRDKYMGDFFRDKILEEKQIRDAQRTQNAEADTSISNSEAAAFEKAKQKGITQEQLDEQRKNDAARRKQKQKEASERKTTKKEKFTKLASDKEADIKTKYGGKKDLVQRIIDRINQLKDCK